MEVEVFVKQCAAQIMDPDFLAVTIDEWKDILNAQAAEIFPEIGYRGSTTVTIDTTLKKTWQVDLSSETNLEEVLEVLAEDKDSKLWPYTDWVYLKEKKRLELYPKTYKEDRLDLTEFEKLYVIWKGFMPTIAKDADTIDLNPAKISLLRKICVKEALRRALFDMSKLDRYRTQVGRMNTYEMLALVRDLTAEIELQKRKLVDSHRVESF